MGSDQPAAGQPQPSAAYFNPRSPDGERLVYEPLGESGSCDFNPRSPDGERPHSVVIRLGQWRNFNPRSPDGERPRFAGNRPAPDRFQSTLPGWGATVRPARVLSLRRVFQSTLPGWGATIPVGKIQTMIQDFNPRSPDGERLGNADMASHHITYFNPRSPDGERPSYHMGEPTGMGISIHAPRMGSDCENGHLRPRYGQNHPFSTLIVSQIVVDVLGTVRKSQKHQRTSHYEVIKQPERRK